MLESRLLKGFEKRARGRRALLVEMCGEEEADAILRAARAKYAALVPEVAAIGGGLMNGSLKATYEYLAYAKAMREAGWPVERIGQYFADAFNSMAGKYPRWLLRGVYRVLRPFVARILRREAAASQHETDPNRWRFDFVEGERGGPDFGMNVTHCAVCNVYARHNASDVVPYLCALDDEMSAALGMGLRRTGTQAVGAPCCDFRYDRNAHPKTLRSQYKLPIVKD